MKVVHVIKRVETIDNDIKELRKLEKSLSRDKSFSTPIYMTIEKQINILLGERIKLLDLKIANPPENFSSEQENEAPEPKAEILPPVPEPEKTVKKSKSGPQAKAQKKNVPEINISDIDDIPMLTQDQIDAKFDSMKKENSPESDRETKPVIADDDEPDKKYSEQDDADEKPTSYDESIKLLDIALEKGALKNKTADKEKKVKFFRENFPST
jgi:hypothetical protein